jgi:hypothetical protein
MIGRSVEEVARGWHGCDFQGQRTSGYTGFGRKEVFAHFCFACLDVKGEARSLNSEGLGTLSEPCRSVRWQFCRKFTRCSRMFSCRLPVLKNRSHTIQLQNA